MEAVEHSVAVLAVAMVIEGAIGYPALVLRTVGHPVMVFGAIIAWLDRSLNRPAWSEQSRRLAGVVAVLVLVAVVLAVTVPLAWRCQSWTVDGVPVGWLIEAALAATLLAQRSLGEHVAAVAEGLGQGVSEGRRAVALIVGRDTASLDEPAIARAAIESLAENFSDGVVAPALWLAVGGLPGIALYKAINTADSMIGHRSPRYRAFGWAAARLDDLVNLPAARLTALLIALGAALTPEASAGGALAAAWRDAGRHRSPNAGWPEAAMAGALGLRLAGPRTYGGEQVDEAWMGDGRAGATAADIDEALALYRRTCLVATALVAGSYAWLSGW
jgi:adenosylcobinamide-phosphate synthase